MVHNEKPAPGTEGGAGETHNTFSGSGESVLMFRDVGGDVTIGGGPPSVPWQVPAAPTSFVNRDTELADLHAVLGTVGGTRVLICEGPRGIGKSAFLRQGSALFRDRFPGGQFYFEFPRRHAAERADPDLAVTSFLRSLGIADRYLPPTYAERVAEFRTRSAHSAMLVVIEGAEDAAQIRPLIPTGPGSALLAAGDGPSLAELEWSEEGARSFTLEPLTAEAGRELLRKLCGPRIVPEEPRGQDQPGGQDAVGRLVAACEGLPLAIVMVAARLRRQPKGDVRALAEELRDEKRRLAGMGVGEHLTLSATFGLSYRRLSASAAVLYRALGAWPGTHVDNGLAAVLLGTGEDVGPLLRELADANLVELVEARGARRYRFRHALIRLDARDRAEREDTAHQRSDRLRRGLDHFLAVVAFADRAVMGTRTRVVDIDALTRGRTDPFDGDGSRALHRLAEERETLVAAVRAAAREGLHGHAWRLAEAATALYLNIRYLNDWVETGTAGADSARIEGEARAEARLRSLVSRPLTDLGAIDRAEDQLERALEVVEGTGDAMLEASVHEFRGRYLDQVAPEQAIAAYDRAQRLCESSGDERNGPRGAALAVYFRGCSRDAAGDHAAACTELADALDRFRALPEPDERMAARAQASLGRARFRDGRAAEASAALNDAVHALSAGGHAYYEADAREALAEVLQSLGLGTEARPHLVRALEIYRSGGSPRAREIESRLTGSDEGPGRGAHRS